MSVGLSMIWDTLDIATGKKSPAKSGDRKISNGLNDLVLMLSKDREELKEIIGKLSSGNFTARLLIDILSSNEDELIIPLYGYQSELLEILKERLEFLEQQLSTANAAAIRELEAAEDNS